MTELQKGILKTLLYFDIFAFPLRREELLRFCRVSAKGEELHQALNELAEMGLIFCREDFYAIPGRPELIPQRKRKHEISLRLLQTARRNAGLISMFPFVRGIAISGSLSKFSADEQADIDFFILTEGRRLWLCRSLLHVFKKFTFLLGQQHGFCMNHFLDRQELELKDKNIFTAIESLTLIPLYGNGIWDSFRDHNRWIEDVFPNAASGKQWPAFPLPQKNRPFKQLLESCFAGAVGDRINHLLWFGTLSWWRFKFNLQGYSAQLFDKGMRSTLGESKYHPHDYQDIILKKYEQRTGEAAVSEYHF